MEVNICLHCGIHFKRDNCKKRGPDGCFSVEGPKALPTKLFKLNFDSKTISQLFIKTGDNGAVNKAVQNGTETTHARLSDEV